MNDKKRGTYGAVQSVQFSPIEEEGNSSPTKQQLQLLTDVSIQLSFELGRTQKTVREILQLKKGSIIGLDKLAGEYVDVHVNSQSIAKGEVVVLNDKFAVRITDVVTNREKEKKIR